MGRRREDNLLPVALALRRESPLTSPDTKVEIGSEKTTKSFQNQNAGEQSHHRHVRQEYDDTVECVDKTCFFYHQLTSVCHIYVKADESAICEVPCDMSGCVDEIHLDIDCPIWVCTPKASTSTSTSTTLRPTTTPGAGGGCTGLTCILSVTGNVFMGLILLTLAIGFFVKKFHDNRPDRRSSTDESRPLLLPPTESASRSSGASQQVQPEDIAVLPVEPAGTGRFSGSFNVQPHISSSNMEEIPLLSRVTESSERSSPVATSSTAATSGPSAPSGPPATASASASTGPKTPMTGFFKKIRLSATQLRESAQMPRFGKKLEKKASKESVSSLDRGFLSAWQDPVTPPFDSMTSFSTTVASSVVESRFMPTAPPMLSSGSLPNLAKRN